MASARDGDEALALPAASAVPGRAAEFGELQGVTGPAPVPVMVARATVVMPWPICPAVGYRGEQKGCGDDPAGLIAGQLCTGT